MAKIIDPLNLGLLMPGADTPNKLKRVTTGLVFQSSSKTFHPEGLYSNEIFGLQGSKERNTQMAYIDIKFPLVHPRIFLGMTRAVGLYKDIMMGSVYAVWDAKEKDFEKSTVEEGETGYEFFISHLNEIVLKDSGSLSRKILIELFEEYPDRTIRYFPVSPAGKRDYFIDKEGKPSQDEVNDIYVSIIALTNIIPSGLPRATNAIDTVRWNTQTKIQEYFSYIVDDTILGKRGFANKRWVARRIHSGTKNVMTAFKQPAVDINDPSRSLVTHVLISLFQALKGSPDLVSYHMKTGLLSEVFIEGDGMRMVDKKTLRQVSLPHDQDYHNLIFDSEGIVKLIDAFRYDGIRKRVIEYKNAFLALVYEDFENNEVQVLHDIDELESSKNRDLVRPIDLADLFYLSAYKALHNRPSTSTRYPVMSTGGIYYGKNYLKPTSDVTHMYVIDSAGERTGELYRSYPLYESGFFSSSSPNPTRLETLAGDHDGDMLGNNQTHTNEAVSEINTRLKEADGYLAGDGGLLFSLSGGVLPLVLSSITG